MIRTRRPLAVLIVAVLVAACATTTLPIDQAKRGGQIISTLWTVVQNAMIEVCVQKKLTDAQCEKFAKIDDKVLQAVKTYGAAILAAQTMESQLSEDRINALLGTVIEAVGEGVTLAKTFGVKLPKEVVEYFEKGGK